MTISKNFVVISFKTENLSKFEQQTLLSQYVQKGPTYVLNQKAKRILILWPASFVIGKRTTTFCSMWPVLYKPDLQVGLPMRFALSDIKLSRDFQQRLMQLKRFILGLFCRLSIKLSKQYLLNLVLCLVTSCLGRKYCIPYSGLTIYDPNS